MNYEVYCDSYAKKQASKYLVPTFHYIYRTVPSFSAINTYPIFTIKGEDFVIDDFGGKVKVNLLKDMEIYWKYV